MTSAGLESLYLVYGVLSSFSMNIIQLGTHLSGGNW